MKKGENEVIVFDIIGPKEVKSEGLSEPLLDQLLVTKPLTHRNEGENLDLSGEQPVLSGSFNPGNGWQERKFDQPVTGRYVCLEALSAQDGKDLACIAEMYLLDENGGTSVTRTLDCQLCRQRRRIPRQLFCGQNLRPPGINLLEHNKRHSIPAFCRD